MEPKSMQSIDPKLQETYNRVMGTKVPEGQIPNPPETQEQLYEQATDNEPVTPAPPMTEQEAAASASSPYMSPGTSQPLPNPANMPQEEQPASPLLKIAYIIGGVIFFVVYTIFWIKIFNLPFIF